MMKIKLKISFLLSMLLCIASTEICAQRFNAAAVAGFNFSQIDGDSLIGFTKTGLDLGFKLDYPFHDKVDVSLEMLYSQRGSNSDFGFGGQGSNFTDLKYLSLPLSVTIKDWYVEDADYHKVSAHAGLNTSYLFDVSSVNGAFTNQIDNFKRVDLSYFLGATYKFNKRLGTTVRYTRSMISLVDSGAISYYITIRGEYYF